MKKLLNLDASSSWVPGGNGKSLLVQEDYHRF